jgi:hypothetical protein
MSRRVTLKVKCESCKDVIQVEMNKPSLLQTSYAIVDCVHCDCRFRVHAMKPRGVASASAVQIMLEPIELNT